MPWHKSNNAAEVVAITDCLERQPRGVHIRAHIDSMYVITGIKKQPGNMRRVVRSSCRAEWGRLRKAVKGRVGTFEARHVRSHPLDMEGEDLGWEVLDGPQKLNNVADTLAEMGKEGEATPEFDFPIGELDHALFDHGKRVDGDPKKNYATPDEGAVEDC